MSKINKLAETYEYVYQGVVQSVSVTVHINYAQGHITLADHNPNNANSVIAKTWKFGKRELEYMQGWQDILSAMKQAIDDATEKLKAYREIEQKRKEELAAKVMQESQS